MHSILDKSDAQTSVTFNPTDFSIGIISQFFYAEIDNMRNIPYQLKSLLRNK